MVLSTFMKGVLVLSFLGIESPQVYAVTQKASEPSEGQIQEELNVASVISEAESSLSLKQLESLSEWEREEDSFMHRVHEIQQRLDNP